MPNIGARIAKLRVLKGFKTVGEFANFCGIAQSTISDIENSKITNPGILNLIKIIDSCKLEPQEAYELVFGKKIENSLLNKISELEQKNERLLDANLKLIERLPSHIHIPKAGVGSDKKPVLQKQITASGYP